MNGVLLDSLPIGDPEVLIRFVKAQYPGAAFTVKLDPLGNVLTPDNSEIELVFAKNITTSFQHAAASADAAMICDKLNS